MMDNRPKVFISYCQHPEENKIRVMQLAERLTRDGVFVVIDEWDLHNGQDKDMFMEQMVSDNSVNKVLMLFNKNYVEKADSRKGGVGIESTIISGEIYEQHNQTKFIPVVMELDQYGKAYLPIYAKNRIYIDLSNDDTFEIGYDKLLRDIYDKPQSQRPPLGEMPSYLNNDTPMTLPTAGMVDSIKKSIISDNKNVGMLIRNYMDVFIKSIFEYKIDIVTLDDENIIKITEDSIHNMQPLKNDFISFLRVIANTNHCTSDLFIDFFEKILQTYEDEGINLLTGEDLVSYSFDNFRYFNYDLFLSFATVMINKERYDVLNSVVKYQFCVISGIRFNQIMVQRFTRFREYLYTLDKIKNERFSMRRVSITADTMKKYSGDLKFDDMVCTDILLYYLSLIYPGDGYLDWFWYPTLSVYNNKIEIFPKIISKRFFDKVKVLFDVDSPNDFKDLILKIHEADIRDGYHRVPDIKKGLSIDKVATIN